MDLGIVVRSDRGGLAAMTFEQVQHLDPAKVLVVHIGNARGQDHDEMYPGAMHATDPIDAETARVFCEGLDTILTSEVWYGDELPNAAKAAGVHRVLVAMPELFSKDYQYDTLINPTDWMQESMPNGTVVLPNPIALERFVYRVRKEVKTFYHLASPAMLDRNGSDIFKSALVSLTVPTDVIIRDSEEVDAYRTTVGLANVLVLPGHATPWYWQHWPLDADCFVLPRRYGGLCLPMQEAAAQGMAVITSRISPQASWFDEKQTVPSARRRVAGMKGGRVFCYDTQPEAVAWAMDRYSKGESSAQKASEQNLRWARLRSWDELLPSWKGVLGED